MNPYIVYPQNAEQASLIKETLAKNKVKMVRISNLQIEEMEDFIFGNMINKVQTGKTVSRETVMKKLNK